MFAYCPFAFARQAHIQLLMIGFLPWVHAVVAPLPRSHHDSARDRARRGDGLTGLACAYYGIFAGGMIAFASIWFAITRRRWKDIEVLDRGRGRGRRVRRADRAVLPALPADAGIDRIPAPVERPVLRERRRVADLIGLGASLVGGRICGSRAKGCSRASSRSSSAAGARRSCANATAIGLKRDEALVLRRPRDVHVLGHARTGGRSVHRCSTTRSRCSRSCERRRARASS